MSSAPSDDVQSLHGVGSDAGYTSQASSFTHSRKRGRTLGSPRVLTADTSSTGSRREGSINARFDRLTSSMSAVAAGSSTAEGVGKSLGVERKIITKTGDKMKDSVEGSAAKAVDAEGIGGRWPEEATSEMQRRQRRRMNEARVGPGSSLGAVGEAFRLLSWEGRRRSDSDAGSGGEAGHAEAQLPRLEQLPSPSGSGRIRTFTRSGRSHVALTQPLPILVPPWEKDHQLASPPRVFSPPPRWLARIIAPPAPSHTLSDSRSQSHAIVQPAQPLQSFMQDSLPDVAAIPARPLQDLDPPYNVDHSPSHLSYLAPFSTSGRLPPSPAPSSASIRPHSRQRPFFEAQLARGGPAWTAQGTPVRGVGEHWQVEGDQCGRSGEQSTLFAHDFFELLSPSPPAVAQSQLFHIEDDQAQGDALGGRLYLSSTQYAQPSTSTIHSAVDGWLRPPLGLHDSTMDGTTSEEPRRPIGPEMGESEEMIDFWRRAPAPNQVEAHQGPARSPRRDRYAETLLQDANALAIIDPLASQGQPETLQVTSQHDAAPNPIATPRRPPNIPENPPPLSRKSSSSASRPPLAPISLSPAPQQTLAPQPTSAVYQVPRPAPLPTRQSSFPRPDPVYRPATAPNPPTSPLLPVKDASLAVEEEQEGSATEQPDQGLDTIAEAASPLASPARPIHSARRSPRPASVGGEDEVANVEAELEEDEDELESRSTDGDSIFPPSLGGTTMTRYDWDEIEAMREDEFEVKGAMAEDEGPAWTIYEDAEDPIEGFTQG